MKRGRTLAVAQPIAIVAIAGLVTIGVFAAAPSGSTHQTIVDKSVKRNVPDLHHILGACQGAGGTCSLTFDGVKCTSPVLTSGQRLEAYWMGSETTFRVRTTVRGSGDKTRVTTSGWKTKFTSSGEIFCKLA